MNLNNIRLAAKLWLATGLMIFALCALVAFAATRSGGDRAESAAVLDGLTTKIKLTNRWAGLTETNAARSQAILLSSDVAVEAGLKESISATSAQIGDIQKSIEGTQLTPADREQMEKIASWVCRILRDPQNVELQQQTRQEVAELCEKFPVPA